MSDTHRHAGAVLPPGVLTTRSRSLPDGLPFHAHAVALAAPEAAALAGLLLVPRFTAFVTDHVGETYSPLPYLLAFEGFDHMECGHHLPVELPGEPADRKGWALRRRRDQVEVSRYRKSLFRGRPASFPEREGGEEWWSRAVARQGSVVVLIPDSTPVETDPEVLARSVTGSWGVLPARNF
ncbi:hypothetical protein ACFRMQ_12265 [Kitasatospora sp. NPDC056783]|uniref:hypothetical protein n=1 Tax=Kitasatospora sp. NPDC056783 TaxID=3345943 RepID=UPI0036AD5441